MNRILYSEWFPQIMYNHHQTGPAGAVMFAPPFRDPFNYNFDPLIPLQIEMVGAAMHSRMVAEGKPGTAQRSGAPYSTWYNGGLRTTTYFHNMIGLLTETIGNPTPFEVALIPDRQLPTSDEPFPVAPQTWHFKQSIEYSMTANRAVLDLASKYREDFLFNIYRMGRNSIQRGSRDSWTITPKRIEALKEIAAKNNEPKQQRNAPRSSGAGQVSSAEIPGPDGRPAGLPANLYASVLHDPAMRDPRGYIVPSDQPDFPTATKFIDTLIKNGIVVDRATAPFDVAGKHYPAGSWVVKTAQAFRPHILDMFEPQDHPNDFRYPGGPPIPPYDVTGYTLAYQMGVRFDRVLDPFDGPFEKVTGLQKAPAEKILGVSKPAGYLISHEQNDSFIVVNRLLKERRRRVLVKTAYDFSGASRRCGNHVCPGARSDCTASREGHGELGITVEGVETRPSGDAIKLKPIRIGLWDQYGGSMTSGWLRWIFEQFEFPFEVVYPAALDQGDLASRFDVLVFPSGAMPRLPGAAPSRGGFSFRQPNAEEIPEEYRKMLGNVTVDKTIPQLQKFVQAGGTIVTVGDSTSLAQFFGLPVRNALVEMAADGHVTRFRKKSSTSLAPYCRSASTIPIRSPTACPQPPMSSSRTVPHFVCRPTLNSKA